MTFSLSPVFFSTWLKISKANEFPDSIRATWSVVRSMGTGSVGSTSSVLLHDININKIIRKTADDDLIIMVFIIVYFMD
jgi:putative heme degradation protein